MNLLSLESWRQYLQYNPYHMFGMSNADVPVTSNCNSVVYEYDYINAQAVGRVSIRQAIESAENILASYLGYNVAPKYTQVEVPWPRYFDNARSRYVGIDATGRWIAPRMPDSGYVQAVGIESLTLVGNATKSNPPVGGDSLVFSNQWNTGLSLNDTFTITISTTETDPSKLAVYFVAADRLDGQPVGARWRIEPVQVSIAAGVATIVGRIWTIVRPAAYQGINVQPLDPSVITPSGPYAQSLAVYVRTTDPNGITIDDSQAVVIWETSPFHGAWCCCSGCQSATYDPANAVNDPAALASAVARGTIRDSRTGLVGIGEAFYNQTSGLWSSLAWDTCAEPDRVIVRLLSGYPLDGDNQIDPLYREIVAVMSMAQLGAPICACEIANKKLHYWQTDLARSAGNNDEAFGFITREMLNNPFGTRRGQVWAWLQVRNLRVTPAMVGF